MKRLRFTPQAWVNNYAIEVDAEGPVTCEVPDDDVEGLRSDSYESDDLRYHQNAPPWWGEWRGPFSVAIEEVYP